MPIITLLTDFGLSDTFIGVMKGVIWSIAPEAKIVDLTHHIQPQNVLEGALAIAESVPYFPAGSIHVCVVDPGVGTQRRPMAALIGGQYFVGPDNGLFTLLIEKAADWTEAPVYVELNQKRYWLPQVSQSFHGRDIFSPVAAHLARGIALEELGSPFADPEVISIPKPVKTERGWRGQVLRADHFGNLVTNLSRQQLPVDGGVILHVKGESINGIVSTFGSRPAGDLIAMLDSGGHIAISVVNGSAADKLGVKAGEPVELIAAAGAGQ